ncbi:unnamed protein product [Dracunculus medinensis]|uniref:Phosphatidylglycerophosphatase and protein-tyrosine phosphatase 1 n=1 Tax=Dracunculus medinensis TaxID=318479 RepID=A0A158Q5K7_DRAME|nr:unnamed protein product [Dracunculus medinensis]
MLTELAFYPSLGYNLLRNYLQPSSWKWYTRIDDIVIIGALPFKSMVEELEKENIGGVVCCTEEFETNAAWGAMNEEDWKKHDVEFYALPMRDFNGSASRNDIDHAVKFVDNIGNRGKSVYVHCKAGRTRSALLTTCYLMRKNDWLPNVAFEYLKSKRPHVLLKEAQWRSANEYRRFLDHTKQKSSI